ncbi:MAG: hypothetical protein KUG72_12235 [Pseudomonadales bacterium]|nr:hypothetical protein [Pseudomonadales bacterium]
MTRARKELIAIEDTPYYHCISRCVRRAYLCGEDVQSRQYFDHRKVWLVEHIKFLASVFSIDVCAYAVMSNHYHLVLFVNQEQASSWSEEEVIERWGTLFPASTQRTQNLLKNAESDAVRKVYQEKIETWRDNLRDISWFMRSLNEYVARKANKEDGCKGRFWEGRFKSQALLDEKALLSCMAYVDLNPIRAKMAQTPEASDFTSIQERLYHVADQQSQPSKPQKQLIKRYKNYFLDKTEEQNLDGEYDQQAELKPLCGSSHTPLSDGIPYNQQDYFELVDWTGRAIREDKRGVIDDRLPSILTRMGIESENWIESVTRFQKHFFDVAGTMTSLNEYQQKQNQRREQQKEGAAPIEWIKGKSACARLYG